MKGLDYLTVPWINIFIPVIHYVLITGKTMFFISFFQTAGSGLRSTSLTVLGLMV